MVRGGQYGWQVDVPMGRARRDPAADYVGGNLHVKTDMPAHITGAKQLHKGGK